MPSSSRALLPLQLSALLLATLLLTSLWYGLGKPRQIDLPPLPERLQCASYTPFGKHQSPFNQPLVISREQMERDLALLATRFECLRTYSVTGLEALPEIAREHGLQLMVGAWVSRSETDTRAELDGLIRIANAYPEVIRAVIVGNEALLRKEITGPALAALISEVKAAVPQPVTYADVWEFWLEHPEVEPAVDFLTIHLLPYWEDDPSGIDSALHSVAQVRELFGRRFAPKDILIGESGWPSEGRQRETAVPSRVNQARFIRGFVNLADQNGWHYNLIEAFDQPWKRINEGAVGGYWGLFDADRQDKGVFAGPVSNMPHWPYWLLIGLAPLLAALLLGGRARSLAQALRTPLLAAVAGACLSLWLEQAWIGSRNLGEWLWVTALTALNLLVLIHAALLGTDDGWRARWLALFERHAGSLLLGCAAVAGVLALQLVFDARYRMFPSSAILLPALFYAWRPVPAPRREILLLALLLGALIAPQLYQETWFNLHAIGWACSCALMVAALWRSLRLRSADVGADVGADGEAGPAAETKPLSEPLR
jgi:exo-beta-1,3-glucanase (GH17 family)